MQYVYNVCNMWTFSNRRHQCRQCANTIHTYIRFKWSKQFSYQRYSTFSLFRGNLENKIVACLPNGKILYGISFVYTDWTIHSQINIHIHWNFQIFSFHSYILTVFWIWIHATMMIPQHATIYCIHSLLSFPQTRGLYKWFYLYTSSTYIVWYASC